MFATPLNPELDLTMNKRLSLSHVTARRSSRGFTLIDLIAVTAVLALLAITLAPALARTQTSSRGIQCLNNNRQLCAAWRMYAEDSHDKVPYAGDDGTGLSNPLNQYAWTQTHLDFSPSNRQNWDPTYLKQSPLWPYCGNSVGIWRCPADTVYPCTVASGPNAGSYPRQRSMSMLSWFNSADADGFAGCAGYLKYAKMSQVLNPGPAMTIVFLDERCDSINDGEWCSSMSGWPDQRQSWIMIDFPGSYHGNAGGISYVDGHSEIHRWRDPRTTPPLSQYLRLNVPSPNNMDVYWIMEHSTRKR